MEGTLQQNSYFQLAISSRLYLLLLDHQESLLLAIKVHLSVSPTALGVVGGPVLVDARSRTSVSRALSQGMPAEPAVAASYLATVCGNLPVIQICESWDILPSVHVRLHGKSIGRLLLV